MQIVGVKLECVQYGSQLWLSGSAVRAVALLSRPEYGFERIVACCCQRKTIRSSVVDELLAVGKRFGFVSIPHRISPVPKPSAAETACGTTAAEARLAATANEQMNVDLMVNIQDLTSSRTKKVMEKEPARNVRWKTATTTVAALRKAVWDVYNLSSSCSSILACSI